MADKTKTIKNSTDKELDDLLIRLRKESECQSLIAEIKRKSEDPYLSYNSPQISTEIPIESLYHVGKLGMKWGHHSGGGSKSMSSQKRQKILNSPTRLYANRNKFSEAEIQNAMKKMKMERELRNLSRDHLDTGKKYADILLGYTTAAAAVYGLSKTPVGQTIIKSGKTVIKKAISKG